MKVTKMKVTCDNCKCEFKTEKENKINICEDCQRRLVEFLDFEHEAE